MLNKKIFLKLFLSCVILLISGVFFWSGITFGGNKEKQTLLNGQVLGEQQTDIQRRKAKVVRVVDGDTIVVDIDGSEKKLRYIGVDTPETVDPRRPVGCFGKEASNENKRLVEGKIVFLEKDVSEVDKFGRILRYVYLPLEDGTTLFVNDYLAREGFALAKTFPPDVKFADKFVEAQRQARENSRGLWGSCNI